MLLGRKNPIIAVDFDDTIAVNKYPEIGEEMPGAIEGLLELQSYGCHIIIWTCRHGENQQAALDWLAERNFFPDTINDHVSHDMIPGQEMKRKVYANLYLDDKSFPPFPGWPEFMKWVRENV